MYLTSIGVVCHAGRGREALSDYLRAPRPRPGTYIIDEIRPGLEIPYLWAPAEGRRSRTETLAAMALDDALEGLSAAERRAMPLFLASSNIDLLDRESRYVRGRPGAVAFSGPGAGSLARRLAGRFALGGGEFSINTACASGSNALLYARAAIERGACEHAVVVGVESPSRMTASGLHGLQVLTPDRCRPFDRGRNGMLLGEAACAVVLSTVGGGIRLVGGVSALDVEAGPTLTRAEAVSAVLRQAMEETRTQAPVAIKSHGTGTPANDAAEVRGVIACVGMAVPVTSLKSALGHTLGACGVLETAAVADCWQQGFLAPTAGFEHADPELAFSPLERSRPLGPGRVLLNFFGFGGNNCVLVLEKTA